MIFGFVLAPPHPRNRILALATSLVSKVDAAIYEPSGVVKTSMRAWNRSLGSIRSIQNSPAPLKVYSSWSMVTMCGSPWELAAKAWFYLPFSGHSTNTSRYQWGS